MGRKSPRKPLKAPKPTKTSLQVCLKPEKSFSVPKVSHLKNKVQTEKAFTIEEGYLRKHTASSNTNEMEDFTEGWEDLFSSSSKSDYGEDYRNYENADCSIEKIRDAELSLSSHVEFDHLNEPDAFAKVTEWEIEDLEGHFDPKIASTPKSFLEESIGSPSDHNQLNYNSLQIDDHFSNYQLPDNQPETFQDVSYIQPKNSSETKKSNIQEFDGNFNALESHTPTEKLISSNQFENSSELESTLCATKSDGNKVTDSENLDRLNASAELLPVKLPTEFDILNISNIQSSRNDKNYRNEEIIAVPEVETDMVVELTPDEVQVKMNKVLKKLNDRSLLKPEKSVEPKESRQYLKRRIFKTNRLLDKPSNDIFSFKESNELPRKRVRFRQNSSVPQRKGISLTPSEPFEDLNKLSLSERRAILVQRHKDELKKIPICCLTTLKSSFPIFRKCVGLGAQKILPISVCRKLLQYLFIYNKIL